MLDTIPERRNASLVWKNLSITVHRVENNFLQKKKQIFKEIIHNVNGAVECGNLVAVLGSSGAGKSTLMGALAHRNQNNVIVEGDIKVFGKSIGKFMNEISGFVYQDDLFVPTLTVMEHLMFTAKLKYGMSSSAETLETMINELLSEMGLIRLRDKMIGSSFLEKEEIHLSGGEQKRLSVATELLTNPPILFCDEPTTGLDSFSALKLVTILKNLAQKHDKTIICSIHQPNPQVFDLFHQVILLSQGKIVFMGNNNKDSISFLKSQGYHCSEDQNPAEFLVKSVSLGSAREIERLSNNFQNSEFFEYIKLNITNPERNYVPIEKLTPALSPSWIHALYLLTYRNFLSNSRDSSVQVLRILQQLLLSIIIGLCMRGAITMDQSGIQAVFGFVFMLVYENSFPAMSGSITLIPKKINTFFREYSNGTNSPLKFLLSCIISLTPGLIIEAILFTLTLYWVVAYQQSVEVVTLTCLVAILLICNSSAFGMFTSILFKTTSVAVIIAVPIFNAFILCAGFYIRLNALPFYAIWVRYVSWLAYATELFFVLQWRDVKYIKCPSKPNLPCLQDGSEVLSTYNYDVNNFWLDIYVLISMYIIFNTASYICLQHRIKNK